ncbi:MAG: hypothetical protein J7L34_06635 [Thermotogaceae bacterium]|nr:hypothetical protein [Thermotogaceae bacterium]
MFRAIKDLIETLKMELGKINVVDQELSISTNALDVEMPKVSVALAEEVMNVNVNEALYSPAELDVITTSFDGGNVKVHDTHSFSAITACVKNVEVGSDNVPCVLSVEPVKERVYTSNVMFHTGYAVKLFSIKFVSPEIRSGENIQELWKLTMKRAKFVEKEKVLSALERIFKSYSGDVKDLRFVGYFKNVPVGRAEKIIVLNEDLVVFLKRKGKNLKVDVVVVKSPEKLMIEVVR